jgi:hypothetical protein
MWLVALSGVHFSLKIRRCSPPCQSLLTRTGHCRRRKIRCIPHPGDTLNRCANCIRLKKECHFHPVDQQEGPGSAQRRDSQVQGGIGRTSSSSSPNGASHPEMQSGLPYPHLSMPPIHDIGGHIKRPRTNSLSPENKGKSHSPRLPNLMIDNF